LKKRIFGLGREKTISLKNSVRTIKIFKHKKNVICLPTEHQGAQRTRSNVAVHSQIELEFGNVGFEERGKPEYPEKNLSEQSREPTTNSTHK